MTIQLSTAVRNALLDAIETAIGASAILVVRTGAPPANPATANTGTVLATVALPADWMANAAGGVKAKSGTWGDDSADAAGFAGHYRIYASDGATTHLQGLVSQPWAASTAYVVGQQVHNGGSVYRATAAGTSAAAGGPSGTGGAIADNGVTWAYVGGQDMTVDNANFAAGQKFSIDSFTLTAPNA